MSHLTTRQGMPSTRVSAGFGVTARYLLALIVALLLAASAPAADLVDVRPITSKILQVFIQDGKIDYFNARQALANNVIYSEPVNVTAATSTANYTVQSSDDANYATARSPINLGRKSKPLYYNDPYDSGRPTYIMGHRIYIELPTALTAGKTYTIALNNLTNNRSSMTWVFDVNKLRSDAVHVNQVGFAPSSVKVGYLSHWMGSFNTATHASGGLNLDDRIGAQFRIINYATGATAFTGTISKRMAKTVQETTCADYGPQNNYSLADVWECDFSSFTSPGEYVLAVDGIGCSYPFEIGTNVYREPLFYALKGLFTMRAGIVKELDGGRIYPRDHHPNDIIWRYDANWPGGEDASAFNTSAPIVTGIWGFYHDAGDWDSYPSHARVSYALMLAYDLAPTQYKDGDVGNRYKLAASDPNWIDEGSNGLPDILDEASWLPQSYKRARSYLLSAGLGTGGVPGYIGRDAIPDGNNIAAYQDTREWYVSQENTDATYGYAALAAWHAACLNKFQPGHPDYSTWVNEATAAWNWANARSTANSAIRGLAAVAMYRITGTTSYQTIYQTIYNWDTTKDDGEWSNPTETDLAMAIYAMLPTSHPGLDTAFQTTVRNKIIAKADIKVSQTSANSYRCSLETAQMFILGAFATPRHTYITVAHYLTGDAKYLTMMQHAASYQLGGNQLDTVYVSGLGEQPDTSVFDPTAWYTNPGGSIAYDDEMFDGYSTYFGAVSFWFTNSVFSEYVTRSGAYPTPALNSNQWPESESKFFNRFSIQGSEFTIHQQNNYLVYAFGYLNARAGASTTRYVPNVRPTVSLNLNDGQAISTSGTTLTVSASADTRRVKYYYDWHFIGESTDSANGFPVAWVPALPLGTVTLVSAVAYDNTGRISRWSDAGDRSVTISNSGNQPPAAPTGLAATAGNARADLSWTASTGAASYNVKRSTTSGGPYTVIAPAVTTTTYPDTGLTNGTTYYYVVSAVNAYGESPNSGQVSATPTDLVAPSNLTATAVSTSQINLAWQDNAASETGFKVERATASSGPWTQVGTTGANVTTYSATGLTRNKTYYFRVRAYNASADSAYSNVANAKTLTH